MDKNFLDKPKFKTKAQINCNRRLSKLSKQAQSGPDSH